VRPASIPRPRFELRTSEVAKPRPGDQLTVGGETFVVQGDPSEPDLSERQLHARRRVHKAMAALGGISSPAGSCVWHVVGLQRSVREWAMRQGCGGRPVDHKTAAGILIAGLGMLAAHLGYADVKRASCRMLLRSWTTTASGSESGSRQWPPQPTFVTQSGLARRIQQAHAFFGMSHRAISVLTLL
jgi:hypothetical protein